MAWMPGASRVQTFSGNRHKRPISKIVLHTTEGSSWPGYGGGGSAPHFTVHRDGRIRQHIDTAYSAKALVNRRGGVETNNGGCIQIEFIGSCDRSWARKHGLFFTETATDRDLAGLARVLAWIHETHGVPLTATGLSWPTTNAAYATAPQRLSYAQWDAYRGALGHTHVPENDHWDPGAFPVARLLRLALGGLSIPVGGGMGVPRPTAPATDSSRPWRTSPRVAAMSAAEVREVQEILLGFDLDLGSWGADGSYGDATGTAVQQLQTDLDLTADGVWGPATQEAYVTIKSDIAAIKARTDRYLDAPTGDIPRKVLEYPVDLEGHWKGQQSNLRRMRAWYAEDLRQIKEGVATSRAAILKAVEQTGKAQGLTDVQIGQIAAAAAEAATRVSADDVAARLEVAVREG